MVTRSAETSQPDVVVLRKAAQDALLEASGVFLALVYPEEDRLHLVIREPGTEWRSRLTFSRDPSAELVRDRVRRAVTVRMRTPPRVSVEIRGRAAVAAQTLALEAAESESMRP